MIADPNRLGPRPQRHEPVRYAVIGLGWIARDAMLPAFAKARKNSTLTALISREEDKLQEIGDTYGVEKLYTYEQFDECLADGDIEALYIALPNSLHHEYAVRALSAGVHVLCEKPLAVTEDECVEMIEAAETHQVFLMPAYRLHFEKANLRAMEIARSGTLGELRAFNSTFTQNVEDPDDIRLQHDLGGGALYDIGIYCINAARYIFGGEPLEVSAIVDRAPEQRFAEIDEITGAILRFPNGRLATFICSLGAVSTSSYDVIGTHGVLRVSPAYEFDQALRHTLMVNGRVRQRTFSQQDQFAPQLLHFSECIRSGGPPRPSGPEGLADVHIIRSLHDSAESGQPVELDAHTLAMGP